LLSGGMGLIIHMHSWSHDCIMRSSDSVEVRGRDWGHSGTLTKNGNQLAIHLTRSSLYFRKPRGRSRPRDHIPKLASEYGRWEARGASCATVFTDVILAASHQHRLSPALWTTLSGHLPTPPAMSDMHPCLPLHQAHKWVRAYTQQGAG